MLTLSNLDLLLLSTLFFHLNPQILATKKKKFLKNLNSFVALKAVVNALSGDPIKQLKTTFVELHSQTLAELEGLQKFMDPSNLKHSLKSFPEPNIPPFDIILDDIAKLEDELPNEINGLYNVDKRYQIYLASELIRKATSGVRKYLLKPIDQIQNLFKFSKINMTYEEILSLAEKAESQK